MSVWGWCRRGILTRGGERVYLPCQRLGRSLRIDPTDLHTFGRRVAEADLADREAERTPQPRTPTNRLRAAAVRRAEKVLDAAGV